jgi:hypothetical protein
MRSRWLGSGLVNAALACAVVVVSCAFTDDVVPSGLLATPAPHPAIAEAIDTREARGLRSDRAWVEAVASDPASVERWGIRVTLEEAATIDAAEVRYAIGQRERLGLRADEDWVREVVADPRSVERMGIAMSPDEAAIIDRKIDAAEHVIATVNAYRAEHAEEWAGRYLDDAGQVHVLVTGHALEHERALEDLFAGLVDLAVDEVRWTSAELERMVRRVKDPEFHRWLERRGISIEAYGTAEWANRVDIEVRVESTDRDIAGLIIEHLGAEDWLLVEVDEVEPPIELPLGGLTVSVVDQHGAPLTDALLSLHPAQNVQYEDERSAFFTIDERTPGVARWTAIPATSYTVEVWRGYQSGFLGSGHVVVTAGGEAAITIVVHGDQ